MSEEDQWDHDAHLPFEQVDEYVTRTLQLTRRKTNPLNFKDHLHILTCNDCRAEVLSHYRIDAEMSLAGMELAIRLYPPADPEVARYKDTLAHTRRYIRKKQF